MRHWHDRGHAPGLALLTASLPVVAIGRKDRAKLLLGHVLPWNREFGLRNFLRRCGELVELELCNETEVSHPGASACAKQVRVVLCRRADRSYTPILIDR